MRARRSVNVMRVSWRARASLVLCFVLMSVVTPAFADERPWAQGVSEEQQKLALEIYQQGNTLFVQSNHAEALAKYREALTHWDHPAIRYNAAVVLVNLQQPLAAWENLELALKYGAAALGDDVFQQATTYQKLLAAQLSEVELTCDEVGAEVLLDGKQLFVAPGTKTLRVMPGNHQLTANKRGFETFSKVLAPPPGQKLQETVVLVKLRALTVQKRLWATWKPWTAVASGAAVALIGGGLYGWARSDYGSLRSSIDACTNEHGCTLAEVGGEDLERGARMKNIAGNSLMIAGGAVLVTGLVMVFLNQPRAVEVPRGAVSVVPTIGREGAGVTASVAF